MSKKEKLLERILSKPNNFTYNELKTLLEYYGFIEDNKGNTSGSRVIFYLPKSGQKILLHKPHPNNILKIYQIKNIINALKEWGLI